MSHIEGLVLKAMAGHRVSTNTPSAQLLRRHPRPLRPQVILVSAIVPSSLSPLFVFETQDFPFPCSSTVYFKVFSEHFFHLTFLFLQQEKCLHRVNLPNTVNSEVQHKILVPEHSD